MMRTRGRFAGVPAAALVFMLAAAARPHAAILYIGLPDGRSVAYTTRDGRFPWLRVPSADLPAVDAYAAPALADLDGDGDPDALIGEADARVLAFRNDGTATVPRWVRRPDWEPAAESGAPGLGDVDGDGDADLLLGEVDGAVRAFRNTGGPDGPRWEAHAAWDIATGARRARPAIGDLDGDGRADVAIGTDHGEVLLYAGLAGAGFAAQPSWDSPKRSSRGAAALSDLDGDGRIDLVITDGQARSRVYRNTPEGWDERRTWTPDDPGSGPGGPALATGELSVEPPPPPPPPPGGGGGGTAPVARLMASTLGGPPPLRVTFDASASAAPDGAPLSFAWDFGDGSPTPPPAPGSDPSAALLAGRAGYDAAKAIRDAGRYEEAVAAYTAVGHALVALTVIEIAGPITVRGTDRIDRVARWYLQKLAHDVGGIYLFHDVGSATGCARYVASLQWSRESVAQAIAGGFPDLPDANGTSNNLSRALQKLGGLGCEVPANAPVLPAPGELPETGAVIEHVYERAGSYTARVTVRAGTRQATAALTIVVGDGGLPPAPGGPSDNDADPFEGFGATTRGGEGGRVIRIREATEDAVRRAIEAAAPGPAIIRFETTTPIPIRGHLPPLRADFLTVEGNGATLYVPDGAYANLIEVNGHDVIVRNIRLRGGHDNLRAQDGTAYNIVFSHVSSTGAGDDGISVGYGAHDVTVQWCFLAGNTRSLFLKYRDTRNVSVHHSWVMKQWSRGPLVSDGVLADVRNLIVEDWTLWGARFEDASSGNLVSSLFSLSAWARSVGGKTGSALRLSTKGAVFTAGNVYEGVAEPGQEGGATTPLPAPPVTTDPVAEMAPKVRRRAGCLPRDPVDQAYVERADGWDVGESTPFRLSPGS